MVTRALPDTKDWALPRERIVLPVRKALLAGAHLAGALARPTWIALKHVPEWRWLLEREDSPWYPGHRLFRQKHRWQWQGVFDLMLARLLASRGVSGVCGP